MGWRTAKYSHIDPATGRNKRETGKLVKRGGGSGGAIRRLSDGTGRPAEKRIAQKNRRATASRKGR